MRSLAEGSALCAILLFGACATTAPSTSDSSAPVRSSRNVISRAEIDGSSLSNALELIHALRPQWFTHRGQESMALGQGVDVYVDGQRQEQQFLAQVPLGQVERLEFLSPTEATFRFGTQQGSGAILVTTRRP